MKEPANRIKIGTFGAGYVGLVLSACLAESGYHLICMDNDPDKVAVIGKGKVPFFEKGLDELVKNNLKNGRLKITGSIEEVVHNSNMIFLAVGTPEGADGEANLSYLYQAIDDFCKYVKKDTTLVIKSTVPVGTASRISDYIQNQLTNNIKITIVSNPEFLRQGTAVNDFIYPDRVVIGATSTEAAIAVKALYQDIYPEDVPLLVVSNEAAELIKYVSNTMLALRLSFINELANLCDAMGIDIEEVTEAVGYDKRIGHHYMKPGPGFGGSCLPKDVKALEYQSRLISMDLKLIKAISEINQFQKMSVVSRTRDILGGLNNKRVALLGLSFKPGSDDLRESPAIYIAQKMLAEGARLSAFDPVANENARELLPQATYHNDPYEACENCEAVMIMTDWPDFKKLNLEKLKKVMKSPVIFDTRNILTAAEVRTHGFVYLAIGRSLNKSVTAHNGFARNKS